MIATDEHDMTSSANTSFLPKPATAPAELTALLDAAVEKARKALSGTTDEHLSTRRRMTVKGKEVSNQIRYEGIADSVFRHVGHHRGQLFTAAQ